MYDAEKLFNLRIFSKMIRFVCYTPLNGKSIVAWLNEQDLISSRSHHHAFAFFPI